MGFVDTVVNKIVPETFKNSQIYELDFIQLVSGASYKSEIEDRFKKIIQSLNEFEKPILIIDELNNLTSKDNGHQGLVQLLTSELAKGSITFICTVTHDSFRKHIEPNEGLRRRFEIVDLEEPSEQKALTMISDTIEKYKTFHDLEINDDTIEEAIRLSKRFNKERSLPDSAIDLIDRTMSASKYMTETTINKIDEVNKKIAEILTSKKEETEKIFNSRK